MHLVSNADRTLQSIHDFQTDDMTDSFEEAAARAIALAKGTATMDK